MLSKYFIDRPIFATVLSVLITLTGGIALWFLPIAQYPRITPPSVNVSISYPGASAQVVADTVAAPIEQEVNGVPGMLYMSSQSGNDGTYSMSVTFDVDVDLNTALVMMQNRVAMAMPRLPTPVQNQGITIRKKTPDTLCMINFISAVDIVTTDGQLLHGIIKKDNGHEITLRDAAGKLMRVSKEGATITQPPDSDIRLSNFVLINIKDEILRVDGVSDVNIMGQRDYSIRAWLDPQKLASRHLTGMDVASAIRNQNIQAAAGQVGRPPISVGQGFQFPIDTLGRLSTPEQFGNIIVKVGDRAPARPGLGVRAPSPGSGKDDGPFDGTLGMDGSGNTLVGGATIGGGADAGGGGTTGGGASSDILGGLTGAVSSQAPQKRTTRKSGGASQPAIFGPAPPSLGLVRLRDVARVEMGAQNYNMACSLDGLPSVGLNVYQLPGTNALEVGDAIRAKMQELKARFPDDIDYAIAYDTTPFIRESISEVFSTLRDAVILVAIVVLFFLQDWRAMILPMIDVPVALIGTFAVMAAVGYSLNNISLFGLVLAIGIVVDDAIVVLENIQRQMAKGYDSRTATIHAMREISGPIIAITLVLCAVFIPCAFLSGITGRFFRQFAVTIVASTVISALNALTMTPSRAVLLFKSDAQEKGRKGEEEKESAHPQAREALPWWIFGLMGFFSLSLAPLLLYYVSPDEDPGEMDLVPAGQQWSLKAVYFAPGMLVGLVIGWFAIRPVNAGLGWMFRGFNGLFDRLTDVYGWAIGRVLRLSAIVVIAYGGLLFLTYVVFRESPRGFVPQQDMGRLLVSVQLPDSAALARTQEVIAVVDEIIRQVPGVAHTIGLSGTSFVESSNGSNFGSFFVILKPFAERQKRSLRADSIMATLREEFALQVKDARVVVAPSSPVPGISTSGGFKLVVQDRGGLGLPTLQAQTDKFVAKVKEQIGDDQGSKVGANEDDAVPRRPMLAGVNTQFRSNTPQLYMDIDRIKAASLGVSFDEVNQTLQIYLGSLNVNRFNEFGRYWQVTLQADRQFRARVEDINQLQVRNNQGQMVPLGTLVSVRERSGPIYVRRYNLYTAAPITGALLPGVSSGEVIGAVDQISQENLQRSMKTEWTELMFLQIKEGNTTGIVFALAVACVFLALAALYESWALPLAVILVVPLCMLCSIIGVLLSGASVNIFVQIGLVVLVGLACKNAILVVEFARELHGQGKPILEATVEASRLRLRPILMTSFAFILGVVPLCIASGAGAEMRRSLGIVVFSGMVGVTAFGIFLTPVFFYVIQGIGETRLFAGALVQLIVSALIGGLVGTLIGYLLARLGVVHSLWGPLFGAGLGIPTVVAFRGIRLKLLSKSS